MGSRLCNGDQTAEALAAIVTHEESSHLGQVCPIHDIQLMHDSPSSHGQIFLCDVQASPWDTHDIVQLVPNSYCPK